MSPFDWIALGASLLSLTGTGAFIYRANAKEKKAKAEADARLARSLAAIEKARSK